MSTRFMLAEWAKRRNRRFQMDAGVYFEQLLLVLLLFEGIAAVGAIVARALGAI